MDLKIFINKLSNKKILVPVIIFIVLLIIAGGVFWWWQKSQEQVTLEGLSKPIEEMTFEEMEIEVEKLKEKQTQLEEEKINLEELSKYQKEKWERMERADEAFDSGKIGAPDEVVVELVGNNKMIKNEYGEYEITVPQNWIIAKSGDSSWLNFFDESYDPSIRCLSCFYMVISVRRNLDNKSLDEWVKAYRSDNDLSDKEDIILDGVKGYKFFHEITLTVEDEEKPIIDEEGNFIVNEIEVTHSDTSYFFLVKDKLYRFSTDDKGTYHDHTDINLQVINTLKFTNK
jgi:hypothetical protein